MPETATGCSQDVQNGLWRAAPAYSPDGLFAVRFSINIPSFDNIKSGAARLSELTTDSAALVLYGYAFFARTGDQMHFNITGPNGFAIEHTQGIEKTQLHLFRAFGKRRPKAGWPRGQYRGIVTLWRDNHIVAVRQTHLAAAP